MIINTLEAFKSKVRFSVVDVCKRNSDLDFLNSEAVVTLVVSVCPSINRQIVERSERQARW